MKKVITALLICLSSVFYAQENAATLNVNDSNVTSLVFSVDSVDELKSINWDDVKEIFKGNTNKDEKVVFGFKVKDNTEKSKVKIKHSFEVKGKLSDIDNTIALAKKMIKVIENI